MGGRRKPKATPAALAAFGDVHEPGDALEPILSKDVRHALAEWLEEIGAVDELREIGIAPRRRALFEGVPGVGKTTLAHYLAARIGLPMLVVRPERLIDCFVGSTGQNIGALFDLAGSADPGVVVFLDEFDAVAIKRSAAGSGAEEERNAWVNTLLQRIEGYDGFLIAATNFGSHIDQAVWRRFDIHIKLDLPGQFERKKILDRYLVPFGVQASELDELAEAFASASPALMRQFCERLKLQTVIGPRLKYPMDRESVFDRILSSVHPHPDLGLPRLWSQRSADRAVKQLTWPMLSAEAAAKLKGKGKAAPPQPEPDGNVVNLKGRARAAPRPDDQPKSGGE